ncbi:MAG: hypothetical protein M0Z53_15200 [Thermaerobacter sp.]|nr:hypothetical protein [Thermaerobacter sp.]
MAYWGVDSCVPITTSYLADVKSWGGATPSFGGRYLTDNNVCPNGAMSGAEVEICKENYIGIIPIVYNWNLANLSTYTDGQNAAQRCYEAALNNGNGVTVPEARGIAVFLDIETAIPSASFFEGFADTMVASEYVGGIYGNQNDFGSNFCTAAGNDGNVKQLVVWGNEPAITTWTKAVNAPAYGSTKLPCSFSVSAWQYYESPTGSSYPDEDEITTLGFVWTF